MHISYIQGNNTNNNPSFSAIKATPAAKKYIEENLSNIALRKLDKLIEQQKKECF